MRIVFVHGSVETSSAPAYRRALREAALAGWPALAGEGRATPRLDAVEAALAVLEESPLFNAGYGSCLTRDGSVELDAAVMDGARGSFGGVAAMGPVLPAISVARRVLEDTRHVLLVGQGATGFALAGGFALRDLVTPEQRASWERARELAESGAASERFNLYTGMPHDTVGCVVCEAGGLLAAGSSTGGSFFKLPGRAGDTPVCGGGIYASRHAAVVCTGLGEAFIETVLAKRVELLIAGGASAQQAAETAIGILRGEKPGTTGGVLAIDRQGCFGAAHNCSSFPVGLVVDGDVVEFEPARVGG